jgi:hypothetical protein
MDDSPMKSPSDLPLWLTLVVWGFLPATRTPWLTLASLPVSSKGLLIFILLAYYALGRWWPSRGADPDVDRMTVTTTRLVGLVVGYAFLSMAWSRCGGLDRLAMGYTLALTAATFFLARAVLAGRSAEQVELLLQRLAWFMAVTGLVYFAESFVGLGVRSAEGRESAVMGMGVQRVHGPLFGAAYGYCLLLPAMGTALDGATTRRRPISGNLVALLVLGITLLALGSRGALVGLALFLVVFQLASHSARTKLLGLITVVAVAVLAALIVYSNATADRMTNFQDSSRQEAFQAAAQLSAERLPESLAGLGYGDLWPWYIPDVEEGGARRNNRFFVWTRYGYLIYNPHSIMLMLAVELGMVGLLLGVRLVQIPAALALRARRLRRHGGLASGIAGSAVVYMLDLTIFKAWEASLIWWLFVLGGLRLTAGGRPSNGGELPA